MELAPAEQTNPLAHSGSAIPGGCVLHASLSDACGRCATTVAARERRKSSLVHETREGPLSRCERRFDCGCQFKTERSPADKPSLSAEMFRRYRLRRFASLRSIPERIAPNSVAVISRRSAASPNGMAQVPSSSRLQLNPECKCFGRSDASCADHAPVPSAQRQGGRLRGRAIQQRHLLAKTGCTAGSGPLLSGNTIRSGFIGQRQVSHIL
jgi:hypothetical protein